MPSPQLSGYAVASSQTSIEDGAFNLNGAFAASSAVSYEQIFSPISIKKDLGGPKPGFMEPAGGTGSAGNFDKGHLGPTLRELNPYFPSIFNDDGSSFIANNDYVMMANETGGSTTDINIRKLDGRAGIDTVRVVGLRGPLMLSGWGFDLTDRPVPEGSPYYFDQNLVNNRASWETGPVDLKWDKERQVWSGGPHIVCGELQGTIAPAGGIHSPTSFTVKVLRRGSGSALQTLGETITVTNRDVALEYPIPDPDDPDKPPDPNIKIFVIAIRLNYEWLPLWVGCEPLEEEDDDDNN